MYLPPQFNHQNPQHAVQLMRAHPLASVISVDDANLPFVSHLPLHLQERGEQWFLLGHCARANPHWRFMQARPRVVVSFLGPQAYMSPAVYPDLVRVPTWNYVALSATVQARLFDAPQDKEAVVKALIAEHDPAYNQQWQDLGPHYQQKMLAGIVAFELQVLDWQCKVKLNQHRPESHASLYASYAQGGPEEQALAQWMERIGLTNA